MRAAIKNENSYQQIRNLDHVKTHENQLKELWSQYIKRLDEKGFDETARSLRDEYFKIYRSYRSNQKWKEAISN